MNMNRVLVPGHKTDRNSHIQTYNSQPPPTYTNIMKSFPSAARLPPRPTRSSPTRSPSSTSTATMMWTTKTKMAQPSSISSSSHYFQTQNSTKRGDVYIGGSKFIVKSSSSSFGSSNSSSFMNHESAQKTNTLAHHHSTGIPTTTKTDTKLPLVSKRDSFGLLPTIRRSIDELLRDDDDSISSHQSSSVKPIQNVQRATSRLGGNIDTEFDILKSPRKKSESSQGKKEGFLLPRWTDFTSFVEADDEDEDKDDDDRDEEVPVVGDNEPLWTRETILGRIFAIKLASNNGRCETNMAYLLSSTSDCVDLSQNDRSKSWCWETCVITKPIILSSDFPNTPVSSCLMSPFFDGIELGYAFSEDGISFDLPPSRQDRSRSRVIVNGNRVTHLELIVCLNCGKDIFDDGTVFSKTTMKKFRYGKNAYCESCVAEYVAKKRMFSLQGKPSIIKKHQSQSHRTMKPPVMFNAYSPPFLATTSSMMTISATPKPVGSIDCITLPLNDSGMMNSSRATDTFDTSLRFKKQIRKNNRQHRTHHHHHQIL